ncbi:MAG: ABC transporter ATP-binding protein, partial [Candidatus Dormibacteraceae bacterium]
MSEEQHSLEVANLTAGYGGAPIISEVEFKAKRGQMTAIVGPNGAGKSTLLKVVVGIVRPSQGKVTLHGKDVTGMPAQKLVREGISYVPQVANVFPSLTVRENMEMGGYALKSGVKDKVDSLCDMFPDLKLALKRPARSLSGGQRTMLAIARALMLDPTVLILDEPTAGLAPKFVDLVWEQVNKVREMNVAVVIVEQNTRRTLTYADWAYVMVLGRNRLS